MASTPKFQSGNIILLPRGYHHLTTCSFYNTTPRGNKGLKFYFLIFKAKPTSVCINLSPRIGSFLIPPIKTFMFLRKYFTKSTLTGSSRKEKDCERRNLGSQPEMNDSPFSASAGYDIISRTVSSSQKILCHMSFALIVFFNISNYTAK